MAKLFIIGTQKGGTTSLWHYLRQHPLFLSSRVKEPHFFDKPQNYRKGRVCHLVGLKPLVTPDTRPQNTGGREEALDPAVREHLIQEYRSSVSALTELLEEPPKWAVNW